MTRGATKDTKGGQAPQPNQPPIRVALCGLGPIGAQVGRYLLDHAGYQVVAGIDIDPRKVGRDLGQVIGLGRRLSIPVAESLDQVGEAQAAVLTTTSNLKQAAPQICRLVARGVDVVSTCEELSYPWRTQPDLAREIDDEAQRRQVSVLGTGINPGFLMDFLPMACTAVQRRVSSVRVERVQDASRRRLPFQTKIGAGLTLDEFEERVRQGSLRHVGLTESMHLIADKLGWDLDDTLDLVRPVLAERDVVVESRTIAAGRVLGVDQVGRGFYRGRERITLAFRAAIGEPVSQDRIVLDGDPPFEVLIPGGVNGDVGTCAIVVNAIPAVIGAPAGLRTMADIAPISCR